jgi:hypothetical protein
MGLFIKLFIFLYFIVYLMDSDFDFDLILVIRFVFNTLMKVIVWLLKLTIIDLFIIFNFFL